MKKLILILVLAQCSIYSIAQWPNSTDTLYYFNIKLNIITDSATRRPIYHLTEISKAVLKGTKNDFLKFQKKKMREGYLAIGPFLASDEAEKSIYYYQNYKLIFNGKVESDNGKYSWYQVEVIRQKTDGSLLFKRTVARIEYGSNISFANTLADNFEFRHLVIGPFQYGATAEYSKFLNRILETKKGRRKIRQ